MRTCKMIHAALAACLTGGLSVLAEPGRCPPGPPPGGPGFHGPGFRPPPPLPPEEVLRKIGANEEQLTALREAFFTQREQQIGLRAQMEKAELALERLMTGAAPDEKAVLEAVDALNQARGEAFKSEVAAQLKIQKILGAELLKKLRELGPPPGGPKLCGSERMPDDGDLEDLP